ncbi:MAG TPA: uroporphyrinogen-III C-methyltransferase [Candidatus Binataceae bacterium]|nr:uroporphyrinogen-III C-methyltransferase [Candidatus Binataceae bacterium]
MSDRRGRVFLVGAGPGAFDLITLRGAECLRQAECVIYDYLVNPDLLQLAPPGAELIFAGKKGGREKSIDQASLNALLIERARKGRRVVRLKGGDPFIFGRGGEEAEALARAGIGFEVVPGITSAIAAPAFAGIPLTHRKLGSYVAFVTGHESGRGARVPWKELARAARSGGTIVLLMATARMRASLASLVRAGLRATTPAAAVQWGTTASQRTVVGTVATLARRCAAENIGAPTIVTVGESVNLREHLQWFEKLPLFGRRIVVTRSREQGAVLARELRALGADAIEFPTIETIHPASFAAIDEAIDGIDRFDWIIFTSATGVDAFVARLKVLRRDIRSIGRASICAIGPATAVRLEQYALQVAAVPREYRAESIIPAIGSERIRGARILIPRAQVAREVLPEMLRERGASEVVVAPAYRTVKPKGAAVERLRELIKARQIDLVTFTSSSTVSNFCDLVGKARGLKAGAIGPITAETARERGFDVAVCPEKFTVPALIEAISAHFARASQ